MSDSEPETYVEGGSRSGIENASESSSNSDTNDIVNSDSLNASITNSPNDSSSSTLFIPLRYTFLTKPITDKFDRQQKIIFESNPLWREIDENDTNKQFIKLLENNKFIDCLPRLRKVVNDLNNEDNGVCVQLCEDKLLENIITISFEGSVEDINKQRIKLNSYYFQLERWDLKVSKSLLYIDNNLNLELCKHVQEIAESSGVTILITNFKDNILYSVDNDLVQKSNHKYEGYFQDESDEGDGYSYNNYQMLIYGDQDAVRYSHLRLRIILSKLSNPNLVLESFPLELSIQQLIFGPQHVNLKSIQKQSHVDVYTFDNLPEVLASLNQSKLDSRKLSKNYNQIYLIGPCSTNISLAIQLIKEINSKTQGIVKDCVMSHTKLDILISRYRNKIRDIMNRFGTFIQLPYFQANRSLVRIMGSTRSSIEASIQELMKLSGDFYECNYWIHTGKSDEDGLLVRPLQMDNKFEDIRKIAATNNCIITTQNYSLFEIIGYGPETKRTISMIKQLLLESPHDYKTQISYRLEVSLELKSFMAGKKYGKMLRIMSNSNVWIKFIPFNEYNFYVVLTADDYSASESGIQYLEDEYPSEISFYIPDTYHKEIIGSGGSRIQSIMRKHNVFIKFGNSLELYPQIISPHKLPNVVIRCPSKNARSMSLAKDELLESVNERNSEHLNSFIHVPRSHRRIILTENCGIIRQIESKTNSIIQLPDDDEQELVEIRGLNTSSEDACQLMKDILPIDYEFRIAHSSKFFSLINQKSGDFYNKIVVPFRIAFHFELQVYDEVKSKNGDETAPPYHRIVLSYSQDNHEYLEYAIQELTSFLREREFDIIDRSKLKQDPIEHGTAATLGHKRVNANPSSTIANTNIISNNRPRNIPVGPAHTTRRQRYDSKPQPTNPIFEDYNGYEESNSFYNPTSNSYEIGQVNPYNNNQRQYANTNSIPNSSQFPNHRYEGSSSSISSARNVYSEQWQDDEVYQPRHREQSPPPTRKYNDINIRKRDYNNYY